MRPEGAEPSAREQMARLAIDALRRGREEQFDAVIAELRARLDVWRTADGFKKVKHGGEDRELSQPDIQ